MRRWVRGFGLVGALTLALVACTAPTTTVQQHHDGDDDLDHGTDDRGRRRHRAATTSPPTSAPTPASSAPTHGRRRRHAPGFTATPAFCDEATEFDERREIVQSSFSGDSALTLARQAWDELDAVIAGLVDNSPELIAPDVDTTRRAFAGAPRGVRGVRLRHRQAAVRRGQADPALDATLRLTEDPTSRPHPSASTPSWRVRVRHPVAGDRASLSPARRGRRPSRRGGRSSSRPRRARSAERPGWSASG